MPPIIHDILLNKLVQKGEYGPLEKVFKTAIKEKWKISPKAYCVYINALCKQNKMKKAEELLERCIAKKLHHRDMFNTLISKYCKLQNVGNAMRIFNRMKEVGYTPDRFSIIPFMNANAEAGKIEEVKNLFEESKKNGVTSLHYNTLIKAFLKKGDVNAVHMILEEMSSNNIPICDVTIGLIVDNLLNLGEFEEAYRIFLKKGKHYANQYFYSMFIKYFAKLNDIDKCEQVFRWMKEDGVKYNIDVVNTLISAYLQCGELTKALKLLQDIHNMGLKPNIITYSTIIHYCFKSGEMKRIPELLDSMNRNQVFIDDIFCACIIDGYSKNGMMNEAAYVFDNFKKIYPPTTSMYNTLIKGFFEKKDVEKAEEYFQKLLDDDLQPDTLTISIMLDGYCTNNIHDMSKIEALTSKYGTLMDANVLAPLIKIYAKNGIEEAIQVFENAKTNKIVLDDVCYNVMMNLLVSKGKYEMAENLYEEMKMQEIRPSIFTFSILLKIFTRQKDEDKINKLLKDMNYYKIKPDAIFINGIIKYYCERNNKDMAKKWLNEMERSKIKKDVMTEQLIKKWQL